MHIFGGKIILILALSQKNEVEKWLLLTLVQCIGIWLVALRPSQQLRSCRHVQFT